MKRKKKQLKIKISYKHVPAEGNDQHKLDKAFDILFEEVLKRRQEQKR